MKHDTETQHANALMSSRLSGREEYRSIDAFYSAHPAAATSGESDYGVWWKDAQGNPWRVSWVHATGHIYAISMRESRVVIIGNITDEQDVELCLIGWADKCGEPNSLLWVIDRIEQGAQ